MALALSLSLSLLREQHSPDIYHSAINISQVGKGQRLLQDGDPGFQDNNWAAETNNLAMLSKEELLEQLIKLKDTNVHLREYIGNVLSNIIMTNPQVLERKSWSPKTGDFSSGTGSCEVFDAEATGAERRVDENKEKNIIFLVWPVV